MIVFYKNLVKVLLTVSLVYGISNVEVFGGTTAPVNSTINNLISEEGFILENWMSDLTHWELTDDSSKGDFVMETDIEILGWMENANIENWHSLLIVEEEEKLVSEPWMIQLAEW